MQRRMLKGCIYVNAVPAKPVYRLLDKRGFQV